MDERIIFVLSQTASAVELQNATDAEICVFVRSMKIDPNEQSVTGILTGGEASPKRDFGARPVNFLPPVCHMCKRARIFISLEYLIGSTTQAIMNFMPQDRLGPNALCVLEGRNQICTYIYI